jgi:hypothetical protein
MSHITTDHCAGLVGNYQAKVLFEQADSEDNGETTVLQNRMHPSQQKFFDLLGTHISEFKMERAPLNSVELFADSILNSVGLPADSILKLGWVQWVAS